MTQVKSTTDGAILGWDVGGTKSAAVLARANGEIIDRRQWPSNAEAGPDAMLADFHVAADELLARGADVRKIGVSIGGPVNPIEGRVLSPPHLPRWDDVPLRQILTDRYGLAVAVEHDAAACLEAEWLWGAAKGTSTSIYLTCGTGCGAGIMTDGRILRGPTGQSPEVGHIRLTDNGPEAFGKTGCVESFCSGRGIALLAGHMFPDMFGRDTDARTVARLARSGESSALMVLEESARRTGQLCSMLGDIFSPELILLGSLARYLGAWWVDIIRRNFASDVLAANGRNTRIAPAGLGDRLQDLSAVAPAVFNHPHPGEQ